MLFPFVKWFGFGFSSDVQPTYLIFALIFIIICGVNNKIVINHLQMRLIIIIFIGVIVGSLATLIVNDFIMDEVLSFSVIQLVVAYIGFIINVIATSNMLRIQRGINENLIKIAIIAYLLIGITQKYINPLFLSTWVSNLRTNSWRGVTSLASEPSFYGYVCIFLMILAIEFKNGSYLYITCLMIQILVLCAQTGQSASGQGVIKSRKLVLPHKVS